MRFSFRRHLLLLASVILALFSLGLLSRPASAATFGVPSQYATIQAALNAAKKGDTVLIADGTYTGPGNVDLDFGGKNLTVTSQHGAALTIIDCGGSSAVNHRGFYLHSGETAAVINGLTVQNTYESAGSNGAIYNTSNGLTVSNCILQNNTADNGAGIFNYNQSGTLTTVSNCIIRNNNVGGIGGGICNVNRGFLTVTSCIISGNTASNGGGVCNDNNGYSGGNFRLVDCVISGNTANYGGGIQNTNSSGSTFLIANCTLTGNSTGIASHGGGIFQYSGPITLTNDIVYGDTGTEISNFGTDAVAPASHCDVQGGYAGTGNLNANPLFSGPPTDFHLQAGSPCLGAGTPTGAPSTTIDGKTRPNPPSIGAYEADPRTVTAVTIASSLNPAISGQNVTLTAAVKPTQATGTVTFMLSDAALVTVSLNPGGTAAFTTNGLPAGSNVIAAVYNGDTTFASAKSLPLTQTVTGAATTTTLSSSLNPSAVGQTVYLTVRLNGNNPSGTMTLTDTATGTVLGTTSVFGNPVIQFSVSSFAVGVHQIVASYGGDSVNSPSASPTLTQIVRTIMSTPVLSSSLNPSPYGQNVTFSAAVAADSATSPVPTGTVTFTIDSAQSATVILSNGTPATYLASSLAVGLHIVTAAYSGDANYPASSSAALTQTVTSTTPDVYVSPSGSDSSSGTQAAPKQTIQAAINTATSGSKVIVEDGTYTGPGDVDLDFGGKNLTVTSQNGAASTIIDCGGTANASHRGFYLHSGETNAVISGLTIQNGNEGYGGGIYCSGVSAAIQNCILKNNTANSYGGGLYSSTITGNAIAVTNCVLTGNATGVYGGGIFAYNNSGTTALTNCTFTGNGSSRSGTDNGGGIYAQFSGAITLINTLLYGDAGGELGNQYGSNPTYYTIINCDIQGGYTGSGSISADPYFYSSPTDLHLQTGSPCLSAGTASSAPTTTLDGRTRPNPPSIGAYEAAATGTAAATMTLKSSLNPAVAGQSVTFTAAVIGSSGTPTGTVNFSIDGITQAHVPLSSGTASYTTVSLTSGSHSVLATYSGDPSFAPGTSPALIQTVNSIATVTAISSSINPTQYGQEAIFTVTITGSSTTGTGTTGSVTLTDTTTGTMLAVRNVRGGPVTFGYYNLAVGSHQIVAAYGGDNFYSPSTSTPLTQAVTQATTATTLVSRVNPSIAGQSVTFAASVSTASTATPTGTITFSVDGAAQPAVALSSSLTATYATSALTAGTHTITATYSGDASFTSSTSAAFTQAVNAHVNPQYVSPSGSDSNSGTQSAPKLTIQAAINIALSGDTVVVENGAYTGPGDVDLDFGGKNLTVTSQNGAASTIIDCGGTANASHRGFYLHSGETNAVISGLTIQNGNVSAGGSTYFAGGGILDDSAGLSVQNCVLKNNAAGYGGGIFSAENSGIPSLTNCVFTGNAAQLGGGLYVSSGALTAINCTFTGNAASSSSTALSGGGIYYASYSNGNYPYGSGTTTLTNDIFYSDTGGEIGNNGNGAPNAITSHCDVQGGYAGTGNINADPLFVSSSDLHLQSASPCLGMGAASGALATAIDGKTRPDPPSIGAYEGMNASPAATTTTLTSSLNPSTVGQTVSFTATVIGSSGTPTGTVVFTIDGVAQRAVTLSNGYSAAFSTSALTAGMHAVTAAYSGDSGNLASTSSSLMQTVSKIATTTTLTSSLNPSVAGAAVTFTAAVTGSGGSTTGTVTFAVDGAAQPPVTLSGQGTSTGYAVLTTSTLTVGSHTITAAYSGDASFAPGQSSPLTQVVNAHLSPQYVSPSGSDSSPGTQAAPKLTIQAAMNASLSGDTVIVEDGTYSQPGDVNLDFGGRNLTVTSINGAAATIINCESGNSQRGFILDSGETGAVISGLTIENGYQYGNGAGIYNASIGLTVQNCIFQNDTAGAYGLGGGIYNAGGGTTTITGCTFTGNRGSGGGGLYNNNTGTATTLVTNCAFSGDNAGTGYGGGIFNFNNGTGTITITGCTLSANTAIYGGGGIYNYNTAGLITLTNCNLSFNSGSSFYGGGLSNYNAGTGTIAVLNSTISGNGANSGGGVFNNNIAAGGTITFSSDVITGNTANYGDGGGINNSNAGTIIMTNCVIAGNTEQSQYYLGGGLYNANTNSSVSGGTTTLTNCTLTGNASYSGGGVYNDPTNGGSVSLVNDILAGDTGGEIIGMGVSALNCDIQGGYAGIANISADPLFVNASTDLHLQSGSPCLGAGTAGGAPATTIDGRTRPTPPSIGAYEAAMPPVATDVTAQVTVRRGGYSFNRQRNLLQQVIILTNTGPDLTGQVVVAFDGLPQGVAVFRPAGKTVAALPAGSPYLVVVATGGIFASGASVSVPVSFYDPAHMPAPYTPRILAGTGD